MIWVARHPAAGALRQLARACGACSSSTARHSSTDHAPGPGPPGPDQEETIDFGFQQVPREQKQQLVGQVFSSVAPSYDLMNDLMSGGIHRLWKDRLVEALAPSPDLQHIDVAGGTGDVAFRVVRAIRAAALQQQQQQQQQQQPPPQHTPQQPGGGSTNGAAAEQQPSAAGAAAPLHAGGWVTVCDINPDMLAVGRTRAQQQGLAACMSFVEGNAEQLPFASDAFDSYTIAFGIRNVTDRPAALAEALRVLRRGGRFMCLEFSQVQQPLLRELYDAYSMHVIPAIGGLVARDAGSYQYLVESIRQFPDQEAFAAMMRDAGFKAVSYENLTGGIVAMHSGFKL